MFDVLLCAKETCDGVQLVDYTGFFSSDAPQGYNAPGVGIPTLLVNGTFGYSTYSVQVFFAKAGGNDGTGNPDKTFNLLTWPHTVDPDTGYVTWDFSFADLGVADETLRSGWWLFRTTALFSTYDYSNDYRFGFRDDIVDKIDKENLPKPLDCDCDEGCEGPWTIVAKLFLALKGGCCQQSDNFQRNIDYLYNTYQNCCS